jgi:transposase
MRAIDLNVTQGIHGFQAERTAYLEGPDGGRDAHVRLVRAGFRCPGCGQSDVAVYAERDREIAGLPVGRTRLMLHVTVHRIYCPVCGAAHYEQIPFLASPTARVTRQMERTILELRREMSVSAVAAHFGLSWHTVKNIEKSALGRKYAKVRLRDVRHIGIDELYVFRHAPADEKYVTVVRDLDTGAVLEVARGKGEAALAGFSRRIRRYCRKVKTVCMDMSNAYSAWVFKNLRNADVVFDLFHVIKAVNERLDKVRRRVSRDMDAATREAVKGNRRLFLRNEENLEPDEAAALAKARELCKPLSDAYMLKEKLRSIYASAQGEPDASALLEEWCALADGTGLPEMAGMAKTVRRHFTGILAFWRHGGATNAAQEGFNNKIRWLIGQAYGFRDYEYFRLKIFDLPSTSIKKAI